MSQIREQARGILRRMVLPLPRSDKTLNVVIENKGALPDWGIRCGCRVAATYAWRAAHENACTRIVVHASPTHKHAFDTIELFKHHVRRMGWMPRPKRIGGRVPKLLATRGHQAIGNVLDITRPTFTVREQLTSHTLFPATAGKE